MDWKTTITEIASTGLTQKQIAAYCDCGQSNISDLLLGKVKSPSYDLGDKLLRLRRRRRRKLARAPKTIKTVRSSAMRAE